MTLTLCKILHQITMVYYTFCRFLEQLNWMQSNFLQLNPEKTEAKGKTFSDGLQQTL